MGFCSAIQYGVPGIEELKRLKGRHGLGQRADRIRIGCGEPPQSFGQSLELSITTISLPDKPSAGRGEGVSDVILIVPLYSAMIRSVPDECDRLEEIRHAFRTGRYDISRHATARMLRRAIRTDEIEQAMAVAEIIEEYADDKYGPSLLLLGFTHDGRPLHVQLAWPRTRIVTVYEPDPQEWSDWRLRRTSHE
jgi:hypothetical protein